MSSYAFERLSAQENRFLLLEGPNTPMHVTGVSIHHAARRTASGSFDIRAYKRAVESLLHRLPRYRQKLKLVPIENHPVWVDDSHFNLDYHVRHTALPRPGTIEELKKKAARIMVQPLDRRRPLWETWIVEQLEGDRFAVISKVHHCMLDVAHSADMAQLILSPDPNQKIPKASQFVPRPEPSGAQLLRGEWIRRLDLPGQALGRLREIREESESLFSEARARVSALAGFFRAEVADTPLNGEIGPHRRFDWLAMSLDDLKAIRRSLGVPLNDVVLAIVTGAVRRFLVHRYTDPGETEFRVSAPLSVHAGEDEEGERTSEVTPVIVTLPIAEEDVDAQIDAIREQTADLVGSRHALGAEMIMAVAEWTPSAVFSRGARSLARPLPVNLSVTNVPGPQQALYLLGSELLEYYGAFPLMEHTGLAISLVSYNGRIFWGFNADRDLLPDLNYFVRYVNASVEELAQTAGVDLKGLPPSARPKEDAPDATTS